MRSKFKWILTLMAAFLMQFTFAQQTRTITGTVSGDGDPLPGASVLVKNTNNGVVTDFDGKYAIQAKQGDVLVVSYVGYKTMEIGIGSSNTVNVVMVTDGMLSEVVVEGYRTTTKARSTSSATTVSFETIENRPNPNALQTLQGQVAGFNITTGSGQPGAISATIIRGIGTISGNTEPLYVIDGVPQSGSSFRAINPEDILSFNVLKDAAATTLYGNRGSNGVVVVNTRRGATSEFSQVAVTTTTGISTLQNNYYNKMNSRELLMIEKAKGGSNFGSSLTDEEIAAYDVNTEWKDVLLRTAVTRTANLAITGGSKNLRSFTSLNYNNSEGIANMSNFHRFTFRNNLDGKALDGKLSYSTNFSIANVRDDRVPSLGTAAVNQNPIVGALAGLPYLSPSDYINGSQLNDLVRNRATSPFTDLVPILGYTPLLLLDLERNTTTRFNEFQVFGSFKTKYDINPNLSINNTVGVDYTQFTSTQTQRPDGFNGNFFAENEGKPFGGFAFQSFQSDAQVINTFSVNYSKTFNDKHSIDAGVYVEGLFATFKSFNFETDGLNPLNFFPGDGSAFIPEDPENFAFYRRFVNADVAKAALFSQFANIDYDYDETFGLAASFRRDGSYRFRGENVWGNFWSVAGRVNFEKLGFLKDTKFDMLKLRVSYGTNGNQNLAGQSIYALPNFFRDQYFIGTPTYVGQQSAIPVLGNPTVQWEITRQFNVGFDIIYNKRFSANIDIYDKVTDGLFIQRVISAIAGQTSLNGNDGKIRNRGIELNVNYDIIKSSDPKGFKLNVFANGSYNKNEIVSLPSEEIRSGNTILKPGLQVGEYNIFNNVGINPNTGNHLFLTADGNLTETPSDADRFANGFSRVPIYFGGFGLNANYKNFFLTSQFNWVAGVRRFDFDLAGLSDPNSIGQFNLTSDLLNYWTPENRITDQPSLNVANQGFAESSNRFNRDASYLRIRNITFGYDFPKKMLNDTCSLRVFGTVENLFTWTKWRGWDAESPRAGDQNQFPTPRIFTFGAQINL